MAGGVCRGGGVGGSDGEDNEDLIEMAKAHIRAKGEKPFRVIKQQFSFQKTRLRGMAKNRCKVNVLAALTNLFLARHLILEPI